MVKRVKDEEKMTAEEFGEFLKNTREYLGLSQVGMSEFLGMNKTSYNAYENGVRLYRYWKDVELKIRNEMKLNAARMREESSFKNIKDSLKGDIYAMHKKGKNVVQIGTSLDIDERLVEKYLVSIGEEPKLFATSNSGSAIEYTLSNDGVDSVMMDDEFTFDNAIDDVIDDSLGDVIDPSLDGYSFSEDVYSEGLILDEFLDNAEKRA